MKRGDKVVYLEPEIEYLLDALATATAECGYESFEPIIRNGKAEQIFVNGDDLYTRRNVWTSMKEDDSL